MAPTELVAEFDGPAIEFIGPLLLGSIDFNVAITLSSPPSSPSSLSVLGESRNAVGIPLSNDNILFERVTVFPAGERNEMDLDETPTRFEKSASTEFELPFLRKVGGPDGLGACG